MEQKHKPQKQFVGSTGVYTSNFEFEAQYGE
jgi:hypothetical protein